MSLKDYIQGKRHGKEANQLEREAMNDPFLQDAIEGFDSVQGNHLDIIEQLEHKIEKKRSQKNFYIRYAVLSTAAMLALVLGISVFFRPSEIPSPIAKKTVTRIDSDSVKPQNTLQDIAANQKTDKKVTAKEMTFPPAPVKVETRDANVEEDKITEDLTVVVENNNIELAAPIKQENTTVATTTAIQDDKKIIIRGSSSISTQKPKTISGKVVDESGEPIIGASVHLKNNKYVGTITDIEGNFTLPLTGEKTETLEAKYIGYKSKTFAADSTSAVVKLEPDNLALSEVVVAGYGYRKIFKPKISPTASNELSGKMAGISTDSSNKKPVFGVSEFRKYVKSQLSDTLCNNAHYKLTATFFIDGTGKPTGTKIVYSNCRSLETEFLRLTNESPQWTNINKKVKVTIKK